MDYITERITTLIPGARVCNRKGWISLPECLICGKKRKMYAHPKKGYKCWSGSCPDAEGNLKQLVRLLQEHNYPITYRENVYVLSDDEFFKEEDPINYVKKPIIRPLPVGSLPVTHEKRPAYFVNRGYSGDLMIDLDFHYCLGGRFGNRIIIPLKTGFNRSFLAYATKPEWQGIKVVYPENSEISHFLFPYNYIRTKKPKDIVLVEGSTDALRILEHFRVLGHKAGLPLALLGKNISAHHIDFLQTLVNRGANITVCMDGDAEETNRQNALRLSRSFGRDKVFFIQLDQDKDPDNIKDPYEWLNLMEQREWMELSLM